MATAMAGGELDQVRDALSRASELESEMAEQKEKCARLAEEAKEAAAALEQAKQRAVEAFASAVDQEDDEEAVAWLSAALRRCFEDATTREWSRPDPSIKIDERWLKRWLCTGPPRRLCGEALLPWLREVFRFVPFTLAILNRCSRLYHTSALMRIACFCTRVARYCRTSFLGYICLCVSGATWRQTQRCFARRVHTYSRAFTDIVASNSAYATVWSLSFCSIRRMLLVSTGMQSPGRSSV
jgi:hypothetical protein